MTSQPWAKYIKPSLIILTIYILPILLMAAEIIPSELKYHVLIGMSALLFIYAKIRRIKLQALGFTRQNLQRSFRRLMPVSLFVALVIIILFFLGWFRSDGEPAHWSFYIFYIFVAAFLQEFIYRGFLFHLLTEAKVNIRWIIIISSALYGFMHLIFDIPSVIFTFLIGLFWGWAYAKDRNIYSVSASHAVLGALSLLANFS